MGETTKDLYIGLKCQHCGRPIMTKDAIDYISDAFTRGRVEEVKTLLSKLKCRECDRNVSDQVIWNYNELLAKERDDWLFKTREEVWPYENKVKPYGFAVHKSGAFGAVMNNDEYKEES